MMLQPRSAIELADYLRAAARERSPIGSVDLAELNRIRRYAPEDLTVTVEAGITLEALQNELRGHGQWLPIDPPGAGAFSLAEILDHNLSGPRRYGHGTVREHLLGVRVVLSDGRIIHSGGEVVKNVAGYDLMKLFVGAGRSLGIIVEAAFKLRPLPACEMFVARSCPTWNDVSQTLDQVLHSPVMPVVLDLHHLDSATPEVGPFDTRGAGPVGTVVVGFAGSQEEVHWQLNEVTAFGLNQATTLDYAAWFARPNPELPIERASVLPSRLVETLRGLRSSAFVARAGNGLIEYRRPASPAAIRPPLPNGGLMRRVKETFDPAGILPSLPGLAMT